MGIYLEIGNMHIRVSHFAPTLVNFRSPKKNWFIIVSRSSVQIFSLFHSDFEHRQKYFNFLIYSVEWWKTCMKPHETNLHARKSSKYALSSVGQKQQQTTNAKHQVDVVVASWNDRRYPVRCPVCRPVRHPMCHSDHPRLQPSVRCLGRPPIRTLPCRRGPCTASDN